MMEKRLWVLEKATNLVLKKEEEEMKEKETASPQTWPFSSKQTRL